MYLKNKKGSARIFINDYMINQWSHLFSMLMYTFHGSFPSIKA